MESREGVQVEGDSVPSWVAHVCMSAHMCASVCGCVCAWMCVRKSTAARVLFGGVC